MIPGSCFSHTLESPERSVSLHLLVCSVFYFSVESSLLLFLVICSSSYAIHVQSIFHFFYLTAIYTLCAPQFPHTFFLRLWTVFFMLSLQNHGGIFLTWLTIFHVFPLFRTVVPKVFQAATLFFLSPRLQSYHLPSAMHTHASVGSNSFCSQFLFPSLPPPPPIPSHDLPSVLRSSIVLFGEHWFITAVLTYILCLGLVLSLDLTFPPAIYLVLHCWIRFPNLLLSPENKLQMSYLNQTQWSFYLLHLIHTVYSLGQKAL